MPSSRLLLCRPLLLLPPIPLSIGVFSNESALRIRCLMTRLLLFLSCLTVSLCFCTFSPLWLNLLSDTWGRPMRLDLSSKWEADVGPGGWGRLSPRSRLRKLLGFSSRKSVRGRRGLWERGTDSWEAAEGEISSLNARAAENEGGRKRGLTQLKDRALPPFGLVNSFSFHCKVFTCLCFCHYVISQSMDKKDLLL